MIEDDSPKLNAAGLEGDPIEFMVMTEIAIISHLADNLFASVLPKGLTVAQFGVLNHLLRLGVQETIGELANAMQVTPATMSSTVRKLEDKGYISLVANDEDRRVKHVKVSSAGKTLRDSTIANLTPLQTTISGQLSKSEWKTLLPILTKLRFVLRRGG